MVKDEEEAQANDLETVAAASSSPRSTEQQEQFMTIGGRLSLPAVVP
jgi:hypothetical protein